MHSRRQLEYYKVPITADMVQEEISLGHSVVVFVHRVNLSKVVKKEYDEDGNVVGVLEITESEGTAKALKAELRNSYAEKDSHASDLARTTKHVEDLKSQLHAARGTLEEVKTRRTSATGKLEAARGAVAEHAARVAQLERLMAKEAEDFKKVHGSLAQENAEMSDAVSRERELMRELKEELRKSQSAKDMNESDLAKTREHVDELKNQLPHKPHEENSSAAKCKGY